MPPRLTDEQVRIIELIAAGHTDVMMSRKINYSPATVKQKAQRICRLMHARNRSHLVAIAFRSGLLK